MIEKIIEFSARNQFIVYLLVAFALVVGFWAVKQVPLDAIPDLTDTQVIIFTEWMGRSPNLVEDQVTYPVVSAMLSAPRVKVVRGYSMFGMSFVYVIFQDGTDVYWARSRVLEYLSQLQGKFPAGVTPQLGPDATGVGWVYEYALVDKSGTHDLAELRTFQDWHLRYWLASVPGVAEVAGVGGFGKQYQVDLDPSRLIAYNLPISDVISAIRAGNNDVGGRSVEMTGKEYVIRGRGYITSAEQLDKVVVGRRPDGTPLLLRDVANVHLGPEMRRGLTELDGQGEVVGGIVVMRYGENALNVIGRVKAKIKEIEPGLPKGVKIVTTYDRSDLINRSIATLRRTLIEEAVIVSLVIIVFLLHVPSALRAIITLPTAVVLAFIPMKLMGLTANIMSLGGIAIAIGAMVDEAVVMIENVHKKLEHAPPDADRKELIIHACQEIGRPLFFSLMVITVSFLPVFTLEGQAGRLFKPLAYTKTFSMFTAALLSITLAPALMLLLAPKHIVPESRHPVSRSLQRLYHPWMTALMRRRFLSISLAAIAVLSCLPILLLGKLGWEFMPPLNERDILYMPTTLPGVSITEAGRILQVQDKLIKEFPEVEHVFGKTGKASTSTDPAPLDMMETTILLKPEEQWRKTHVRRWYSGWAPASLKPALRRLWPEDRTISWEELRDQLDQRLQLPGVTNAWTMPIKARIDMLTTGIRTPVGIKIFGPDLNQIEKIGQRLETVLHDVPGTRSVYAERTTGGYYVDIIPRREEAARYGLSVTQVEDIVETAIGGTPIGTTVEGPARFTINVRYARELRDDLNRLSHVLVPIPTGGGVMPVSAGSAGAGGMGTSASSTGSSGTMGGGPSMGGGGGMGGGARGAPSLDSPDLSGAAARDGVPDWSRGFGTPRLGAAVPLGQIADIVVSTGPPMIKDEGASLTGWVYIDVVGRAVGDYVNDAKRAASKLALPSGYYLSWTGQYELIEVMWQRLKIVIPITLLIIIVMLYLNSRSVASTAIVLLSVPFAITGSIWMLYLHNLLRPGDPWNLSVAVAVGIIALAGLAAETGVVMIVYLDEAYHRYKAEGRMNTQHDLFHSITEGAVQRVRPKLMTVMCILMGLLPLMWAHGSGADVMRRIAAPMIGGIITSSILTLEIVPAVYSLWRGRSVTWVKDERDGGAAG